MKDADLIYNALLRAERRMEADLRSADDGMEYVAAYAKYVAVAVIREEIGRGLAEARPAIVKAKIGEVG